MTEASVDRARAANLLGAVGLLVAGDLAEVTGGGVRTAAPDAVAVVYLTTTAAGVAQEQLGRVLGLTQSGAARLVDRLVRDGLVERRPGADARTHALHPTGAGQAHARVLLGGRQQRLEARLAGLEDEQVRSLTAALEVLLGDLATDRTAAHRICRLCEPDVCGHSEGRCPVTRAADTADEQRTVGSGGGTTPRMSDSGGTTPQTS